MVQYRMSPGTGELKRQVPACPAASFVRRLQSFSLSNFDEPQASAQLLDTTLCRAWAATMSAAGEAGEQPLQLLDLPMELICKIVRYVELNEAEVPHRTDNLAALRCVCRCLRQAVDAAVSVISIHPGVSPKELAIVMRRCRGGQVYRQIPPLLHVPVLSMQWCRQCRRQQGRAMHRGPQPCWNAPPQASRL